VPGLSASQEQGTASALDEPTAALVGEDANHAGVQQCQADHPGAPCEQCRRHSTECVFDAESDLRRCRASKRRLLELERREQLFDDMLTTIRSCESARVQQLLEIIRRHGSTEELQACIDQGLDDLHAQAPSHSRASEELHEMRRKVAELRDFNDQATVRRRRLAAPPDGGPPEPLPESLTPPQTSSGRRALTIDQLKDIPLFEVPVQPWTRVTADGTFVSHLISLYFTWIHPWYHAVEQDIFLDAMKAGNLGDRFCSPFLVNAMLWWACVSCGSLSSPRPLHCPSLIGNTTYSSFIRIGRRHSRFQGISRPEGMTFTTKR